MASGTSTQLRPNYKQVLEHFRLLLQTLSGINHSLSSSQHVFSIIGDHVKDRMMHLLVNDCLIPAVPETMEEYQASTLCEDVAHFEQYLADSFLINPEVDRGLSQFIEQYETYYRNRLCSRVLESTREIIQRDLQDMVLVAPNNQAMDVTGCDPFLFPRCMVSRSAQVEKDEQDHHPPFRVTLNSYCFRFAGLYEANGTHYATTDGKAGRGRGRSPGRSHWHDAADVHRRGAQGAQETA
ncbi:GL20004 [Drosophila persimilis]|uniref:GL20004 n=1 Tax=Drosophila persimilis TaxID=7234 RepID=B4ISC7_DROPE|nr:GL20004 [Drosophila persimilis]